jgi:uncharacterized MAPEG superfamily protein
MYLLQLPIPTIFLCAIIASAILIYLPYILVAYARVRIGYDLSAPRAMFDKLPPYAQRATWAHENSFETFIVFAAAAVMAYITGVNSANAGIAAIAFVITRFLYSVCYILNIPLLRSLMFGIGSFSCGTLFFLSIMQIKGIG